MDDSESEQHGVCRLGDAKHQCVADRLDLAGAVRRKFGRDGIAEIGDEARRLFVAVRFGEGGESGDVPRRERFCSRRRLLASVYDDRRVPHRPCLVVRSEFQQSHPVATMVQVDEGEFERVAADPAPRDVVGSSWGTTLGTLLVQRHPELFAAYIGTGQMVSQAATDRIMWRDTIAWAQRTGRSDLAKELRANGPPPYTTDVVKTMAPLTIHADDVHPHPESAAFKSLTLTANYFPREYTILDGLNTMKGFADTAAVFYSKLRYIDFLKTVPRLAVPTYVLEGRYENPARAVLARQWFNHLQAPQKQYVVFAHSGHGVMSGDPNAFARYLTSTVLPQTREQSATEKPSALTRAHRGTSAAISRQAR